MTLTLQDMWDQDITYIKLTIYTFLMEKYAEPGDLATIAFPEKGEAGEEHCW